MRRVLGLVVLLVLGVVVLLAVLSARSDDEKSAARPTPSSAPRTSAPAATLAEPTPPDGQGTEATSTTAGRTATTRRPTSPTTPARPANVRPAPASLDRTCATDVSDGLRSFLASVPDGSTITFPASSCYRVENSIVVSGRHNLTIDGKGAVFRATTDGSGLTAWDGKQVNWPRQRSHWTVVNGSSGITIRNVNVEGPNGGMSYSSALEGQSGFLVTASTGVTIEDCSATNVHGDFAEVGGDASNVIVRRCAFSGSGRQGLTVHQGRDVLYEANRVTRVPRSAVDIEPELDWVVQRVTFRANVFTAPIGHVIFANGGTGALVEDVVWIGNRVVGRDFRVKSGGGTSPQTGVPSVHRRFTFIGNTTDTPGASPHWTFANLEGLVVRNNVIPTPSGAFVAKDVGPAPPVWLELTAVTNVAEESNDGGGGTVERR